MSHHYEPVGHRLVEALVGTDDLYLRYEWHEDLVAALGPRRRSRLPKKDYRS